MHESADLPLSVAIPTFMRERVLVDTIGQLLAQVPAAAEILVIDQTPEHTAEVEARLMALAAEGRIRLVRKTIASQPAALNTALLEASQPFVLCLDDDIEIDPGFLERHLEGFVDEGVWAVAGQVLQPGEEEDPDWEHRPSDDPFADCEFRFRSGRAAEVSNGMSGNLCVRRDRALQVGGFDENFRPPVSYRFDNEFCIRLVRGGGRICFAPAARIYHLRAPVGGTRSIGNHLTSASPVHGLGDYYFCLRAGRGFGGLSRILRRPFREVRTRFHLRHPWWIPVKLLGELRALVQAVVLHLGGAATLESDRTGEAPGR
jgi:GT2 family glycosyltransferase